MGLMVIIFLYELTDLATYNEPLNLLPTGLISTDPMRSVVKALCWQFYKGWS
ncbi:hypothetical protein DOCECA_13715 [Pseudomonas sp. E102]